jgi:hypothetical protein
MRRALPLAALLLPLCGCYVPPPDAGYGYAQPGYPPPAGYGYAQPGYPPPTDPYGNVFPGYSYNDGAPSLFVEGAAMPLIFLGGGWGYYDGRHEWHRAPDAVGRHLEQQRASGATFRSGGGGYNQGRPPGPEPFRGQQQQNRPTEQVRPAQPAHQERRRECEPGQRC